MTEDQIPNPQWTATHTTDPDCIVIHTRMRLLDTHQVQSGMKGLETVSDETVGFEVSQVLREILSKKGVSSAEVRAYAVVIRKGHLFSWPEVYAELIPFLDSMIEHENSKLLEMENKPPEETKKGTPCDLFIQTCEAKFDTKIGRHAIFHNVEFKRSPDENPGSSPIVA